MVKANRDEIARALARLSDRWRGALVHGPDEGLVRERADLLARQIVTDPSDPFRVSRLRASELKADPAALADALGALSMTGGRRLVVLDLGGESAAGLHEVVRAALDLPQEGFLLVVAGELVARSPLRALFEKADDLIAIACYADSAAGLGALVDEVLAAADLEADAAAREYLCAHLGQDRSLSRRELEKLVLYKWDARERRVTREDVAAVIGDAAATTVFDLVAAVTAGDLARLDAALDRAFAQGESAVAILRILARRLQQFDLVQAAMAAGQSANQAVDRLVPRLFFKDRDIFLRDLPRWPAARVAAALDRVLAAEADCKTSGLPAETICARTCLALAASVAGAGSVRR